MSKTPTTVQPVAEQPQDFLGSLFSSPEKIFDMLVKILIGFLVLSISMVIIIDKKHFYLLLGLVFLVAIFLAIVIVFKGVFISATTEPQPQVTEEIKKKK